MSFLDTRTNETHVNWSERYFKNITDRNWSRSYYSIKIEDLNNETTYIRNVSFQLLSKGTAFKVNIPSNWIDVKLDVYMVVQASVYLTGGDTTYRQYWPENWRIGISTNSTKLLGSREVGPRRDHYHSIWDGQMSTITEYFKVPFYIDKVHDRGYYQVDDDWHIVVGTTYKNDPKGPYNKTVFSLYSSLTMFYTFCYTKQKMTKNIARLRHSAPASISSSPFYTTPSVSSIDLSLLASALED